MAATMTPKRPKVGGPVSAYRAPATTIPAEEAPLFHQGEGLDATPSEQLKKLCGGCRLNFNWFGSKSVSFTKDVRQTMAESVDTNEEGISASKRLISSKHPVVKRANELKRRIEGTWRSYTLPLAAVGSGDERVEGGTRLIKRDDVPTFDQRMIAFGPEVEAMEREVNAALPDIKELDRQRLKGQFNEADYPTSVTLSYNWGYPAIAVPSYLKQLAPDVYAREVKAVGDRYEKTFELAYMDFLGQFQAAMGTWIDRLGPVIRLYPDEDHPLHRLHGVELVEKVSHADDPEQVPDGKFRVVVRYKKPGAKELSNEDLGLMGSAEFAALQPSEIETERKVFKDTTIEGLTDLLGKFRRLGTTVSASAEFQEVVRRMETQLAKCPTAKAAAEELRNSKTFRTDTHVLMQKLSEQLGREVEVFKQGRRRVDRGVSAPATETPKA